MKKRILSWLLTLALLCTMLPAATLTAHAATYSGTCGAEGDNLTWTLNTATGVLTISGTGAMSDYSDFDGSWWDSNRSAIKSVSLPQGLTSIGSNAFEQCAELTSVTIPDSVTSIGFAAFYGCKSLTSVTIPDSVTSIGMDAFNGCTGLTSVTIGNSVTSIDYGAFCSCFKLRSVHISDLAAWCNISFGDWSANPLYNAHQLWLNDERVTELIIPDRVTSIGEYAFCCCRGLTRVTIPDSVTSIGVGAFESCTSLTSVTIPDSVTNIGEYAFDACTSLASVTIPNSVTSIGEYAFGYSNDQKVDGFTIYGASNSAAEAYASDNGFAFVTLSGTCGKNGDNLTFSFDPETGVLTISGDGAMADWYDKVDGYSASPWNESCDSITSVVFTGNVTSIGWGAFASCASLTSVTIPDSVTSIGGFAFVGCWSLSSITIPDGVTNIGRFAFGGCWSLSSITIPDGVTSIGESAFSVCTRLTRVTIPDSVTNIGDYAFDACTSLSSVTIPDSVTSIGEYAFGYSDGYQKKVDGFTIYGASNSAAEAYASDNGFTFVALYGSCGKNGDNLTFSFDPETGVLTISGDGAMADWNYVVDGHSESPFSKFGDSITSVVFTGNVTHIGDEAFSLCTSLMSVTIPDSVTSIGDWAFFDCTSLTSVTIPDSVTSIGNWAFEGCSSLTNVTIPDSVTSIGECVFCVCSALTSVTIPDSVTSIGFSAFDGCTSLTNVTIPDSVTSIGEWAFFRCTSLTSVTIPNSVTSIGSEAFLNCTGLTSVTIPGSVTSIGEKAFGYYKNNGYQKIDGFTIYGCANSAAETYATDNGFSFVYICTDGSTDHDFQSNVTATCTENGLEIYTCSSCGYTYSEPHSALGHTPGEAVEENRVDPTVTADGSYDTVVYCSVCGEELSRVPNTTEKLKVEVVGTSLTTEGDVLLNAYLDIPDAVVTGSSDLKVKLFDKNNQLLQELPVNSSALTAQGYRFQLNKPAKNMHDEVTLKLYDGDTEIQVYDANGNEIDVIYSVQDYLNEVIINHDNYSDELYALCVAMSNYGSYAQTQQNYNLDKEIIREFVVNNINIVDINSVTTETVITDPAATVSGDTAELRFYGASLVMESEMVLRFYFWYNGSGTLKANRTDLQQSGSSRYYYYDVKNIKATDFDEGQSFTATDGLNSIDVSNFSVYTYVRMVLNAESGTLAEPAMQNLVRSIVIYGKMAEEYYGIQHQ